MKFTPKTVFILENGKYTEITYEELQFREENIVGYKEKWFLPLHGTLMEVTKAEYDDFYKKKRRQKYINESAKECGEIYYSALDTEELNGEDILVSPEEPFDLYIADKLTIEKFPQTLSVLSKEERDIINSLYYEGVSERKLAKIMGIPRTTLGYQKQKILEKLKNILNN